MAVDSKAQASRPDIRPGRLSPAALAENFGDVKPALDAKRALVDSSRCFFCHDAPCTEACPTHIDVPNFIRMINTGNVRGAAETILDANILGGICARVCPVEILCEQACVRNHSEDKPVNIGALQRFAVDRLMAEGRQPFPRAAASGKRIAIVGGGPAGLACAHELARRGHGATIFEARPKLGGLNEYGIAAYKTVADFAQREVDFILGIGGIEVRTDCALGRDIDLADLRRDYAAVFLGIGLGGSNALGLAEETLAGVEDAIAYIAKLRQTPDKSQLAIGRKIVVIGGGNTAIDIAVQSKRLGAEEVTILYRRGAEQMSATHHEQEFAQINGVRIKTWARPLRLIGESGALRAIEAEYTTLDAEGRLAGTGETFRIACDQVFKAIGQKLLPAGTAGDFALLETENGKIAIDHRFMTSLTGVFAGGDCTPGATDLTVQAVADGKAAAIAIDDYLKAR